jgi:hypothetical protein
MHCSYFTTVSTYHVSHNIVLKTYILMPFLMLKCGCLYGSCILCLHSKRINIKLNFAGGLWFGSCKFWPFEGWYMKVWSGWISGVKSVGLITRVSLLLICQCQCRSIPWYLFWASLVEQCHDTLFLSFSFNICTQHDESGSQVVRLSVCCECIHPHLCVLVLEDTVVTFIKT